MQPQPKDFLEQLIYTGNFKRVNVFESTHNSNSTYGIYPIEWQFSKNCEWNHYLKREIPNDSDATTQSEHFKELTEKNLSGRDLYWMPNYSASKEFSFEPKAEEITHARALFIDIDYAITESDLLEKVRSINLPVPSIYFNTFKGWQVFWIFNTPLLLRRKSGYELKDLKSLEAYKQTLNNLVKLFQADPSCINLNRKMRIPNTYRWKGEQNSIFCKGNQAEMPFYRFADFASVAAPIQKVKTPVKVSKTVAAPVQVDLSQPVTMDEFNALVDGYDFKGLLGIGQTGKCRCPFPESHKNGDANPSAFYKKWKGKFRINCSTCKFSYHIRDYLKHRKGLSNSAIFEFLKAETGAGVIVGQDSKFQLTTLNGSFEGFINVAERYNLVQGMIGYRLVCRLLFNEAVEAMKHGNSAFTISTRHLAEKSGMTKMKSDGITNILCYLGIIRKTLNTDSKVETYGNGISQYEFQTVTDADLCEKLDNLIRLKMRNPEKFTRKWVVQNLGMDTATMIYPVKKVVQVD